MCGELNNLFIVNQSRIPPAMFTLQIGKCGGYCGNGKCIFQRKAIITMAKVQTIYGLRPWHGLHRFAGCQDARMPGCRWLMFSQLPCSCLSSILSATLSVIYPLKIVLRFHLSWFCGSICRKRMSGKMRKNTKKKGENCVGWETCFGFGSKSNLPVPSGEQKKWEYKGYNNWIIPCIL